MKRLLTSILICISLVGCTSSRELTSSLLPAKEAQPESPRVTKIVCLWEPGYGKIPNGVKRGILGQVLFFSGSESTPIKVDGDLVVYVFDDQGTVAEQTKPVQKLVLSPEELGAVYAESGIGHSYHIPVPYLKDTDVATNCTLRVRYTSPTGEVTYSDLGSVYLEGRRPEAKNLSVTRTTKPVSADIPSGRTPKETVKTVGKTEIRRATAAPGKLDSLTIRRETPAAPSRAKKPLSRQSMREPLEEETPRKRFRLSNAGTRFENVLTADDFAPMGP